MSSVQVHIPKLRQVFVDHKYTPVVQIISRRNLIVVAVGPEITDNYESLQREIRLAIGNTKIKGISCGVQGEDAVVRIELKPSFYTYIDFK